MTYSDKFKISNNSQFVLPPPRNFVTLLGATNTDTDSMRQVGNTMEQNTEHRTTVNGDS